VKENRDMHASRKRLLLSWYIDFLFFMTLWDLLTYLFRPDEVVPYWIPIVVFVVIRAVISKYIGTIGRNFMSIDKHTSIVSLNILRRENWLTIFLGVLFILEGTKHIVRWTQTLVSQPWFGFFPNEAAQIAIHIVYGLLSVLAGYWFLKLNIKGFILGVGLALLGLISYLLSWKLWDPVVEQMVLKRKEVQGLPVRDGDVEMMQALMPEGIVLATMAMLVAMLVTYSRFRNTKLGVESE